MTDRISDDDLRQWIHDLEKADFHAYPGKAAQHSALCELRDLRAERDSAYESLRRLQAGLVEAQLERDAMDKDARRYRWLESRCGTGCLSAMGSAGTPFLQDIQPGFLGRAIDAALAAQEKV